MGLFDNLLVETNYVEFNFNGGKFQINVMAYHHFTKTFELYKHNKITEASQEILECIKAEPKNQHFHYYKGYFLEDIRDFQGAKEAYESSLQIDPSQHYVNFRLGICLQSKHKYQEAVDAYSKSLLGYFPFSDPLVGFNLTREQVLTNRAISYANLGSSQKCIDDCSNAIKINPKYSNSYFIRGLEFLKINKGIEAEQDIKKASSLNHPKANAILEEYFPKIQEVFEQVKEFADSEQARVNAGGQRPREHYRADIMRYLQENELNTRGDLLDFCNLFLNEIWTAFRSQEQGLDENDKAYVTYELTAAICTIYKKTDHQELFNDLFS
ncbi:MAG: hypothetical protein H7Z76_10770 [Methylotenera sp.]|nr:hypothetical protein [Flavobacterium sp.]